MHDDQHDVHHLFRCLIKTLSDQDPQRLRTAFQVAELYQTIIPYRTHRSRLGFDSNEDYEMAVLRLLAGEGSYASVDPPEAHDALAAEAAAVNPDPGIVREYAGAMVQLARAAVDGALDAERSYAPPEAAEPEPTTAEPDAETRAPAEEPAPPPPAPVFSLDEASRPRADAVHPPDPPDPSPAVSASATVPPRATRPSDGGATTCRNCGRGLPLQRQVTYCPFCGQPAHALVCQACGAELETGWRFCVDCGSGPGHPS